MSDEEDYTIPLQDQRVFGAGIKRKRVKFVPSTGSDSLSQRPTPPPSTSMGDLYLSMVMKKKSEDASKASATQSPTTDASEASTPSVCEVCRLPLSDQTRLQEDGISTSRPHEASIAHQVYLKHSHPPSHIDRSRKGLSYLSSYGWDPDARQGLGASGQGIQFPIKPKSKNDKLGLGLVVPKAELEKFKREKRVEKLDAGKVRKLDEKDRRKRERLQEMFYRNDDVERYLNGR
jgi:hypothetical protein